MKIYSFIKPIIALSLFAITTQPVLATGFNDLSADHPNYDAILDLQERGIIDGYPDGTFKPDQMVNRVEALKIVLLGAGLDVNDTSSQADFTDTDSQAWYAPYITKAVEMDVVEGYPDGSFKPANIINLVESLKVVQLGYDIDLSGIDVTQNPYADAFAGQWYAPYIQYAKDKNLIDSDDLNKVYPDQGMTRGSLAEVIYRLLYIQEHGLDYFGEEVSDQPADEPEEEEETSAFTWNVNIDNNFYKPKDMTVGVGSTVKWTNDDDTDHTVTGDGLDSGTLEPGDTYEYTFNEEGTFEYTCEFHPTMSGSITVKPANDVPTI